RAVVVLEACDLPIAENSVDEAVATEPEAPVRAHGYLPDGVRCKHMPLVGGVVAALLGEAEIVLGSSGLVRSGGCTDAVPPCIARRSIEASNEPPVPVQVQGVVAAAAAARFDIHLGVAVAELALDDGGAGSGIHRNSSDAIGDRALKQVSALTAYVSCCQRGTVGKRLLDRG